MTTGSDIPYGVSLPIPTLPQGVYRVNVPNRRGRVIVVSAWGKSAPTLLAASAGTGLAETTIEAAATGSTRGAIDAVPIPIFPT
jgi:hypothetical protein